MALPFMDSIDYVVTATRNVTIVTLVIDEMIIGEGVAKRHPGDRADAGIGVTLAMVRALDQYTTQLRSHLPLDVVSK